MGRRGPVGVSSDYDELANPEHVPSLLPVPTTAAILLPPNPELVDPPLR